MSDHYTSEERALHKLLGAAYQMTFTDNHARATRATRLALEHGVEHFEVDAMGSEGDVSGELEDVRRQLQSVSDRLSNLEDSVEEIDVPDVIEAESSDEYEPREPTQRRLDPSEEDTSGQIEDLPSAGTESRQAFFIFANAMRDEDDWIATHEAFERTNADTSLRSVVSGAFGYYDECVEARERSNGNKEYRIKEPYYSLLQAGSPQTNGADPAPADD